MNAFQKFAVTAVLMAFSISAGFAAETAPPATNLLGGKEVIEKPWTQRCTDPKDTTKNCEIFQRLEIKDSTHRVSEFAVGFPAGPKTGTARGVIILPLGILLEEGISMTIDNGKPYVFKSRYCTNAGCYSYISMDKNLLDAMKNGKKTKFLFKTVNGDTINIEMNLDGFGQMLKKLS